MARVLYLSQYFVSADQPGGARHWRHTRALAAAGHQVSVVTSFVQHKERAIPERYRGRRVVRTAEDGLDVWRVYATPGYGSDARSRARNYASFVPWALVAAMRAPRPDVVVASSPPLTAGAAGAAVATARRARFVFEVRDLWPESAAATGLVSDPRVIRVMDLMARACERRADRAVALTEGIRDGLVARGMSPARISLITNGADLDLAPNGAAPVPVPDGAFVAMFVGQHGTYGALHTVLDAADRLRGDERVRFVLVGGGDRKPALVEEAARRGLANVTFVDPVPRREVPAWLARADVCLLPYQDSPLFAGALPNKTFDYLGAGRPIVAAVPEGELSALVRRAACGIPVPPEDGAAMAAAVRRLADDPAAAARMGADGAAYVREHYDRADLAARFVSLVESLA